MLKSGNPKNQNFRNPGIKKSRNVEIQESKNLEIQKIKIEKKSRNYDCFSMNFIILSLKGNESLDE